MNIGSTSDKQNKGVKAEAPARQNPHEANKKALQQEGLRQAAAFYQQSVTVNVKASEASIGMTVMSRTFEATLVINGQHPKAESLQQEDGESPVFDYEKIAANVMKFVGGVIRGAAVSGADNEKLSGLFEQARDGVAKGFSMARNELKGLMNDELETGIENSEALIKEKMLQLEDEIFGDDKQVSATAMSYEQHRSGELEIRTKEGDLVNITFASAQSFDYAQTELNQTGNHNDTTSASATYLNMSNSRNMQITVKGELSEDELNSIAGLVENTAELTDLFFNDDIDKAYEQAVAMGIDETTLAGYSLNLEKRETLGKAGAYSDIKAMGNNNIAVPSQYKAVSAYLNKMMQTLQHADAKLNSPSDYQAMVGAVIRQMEDIQLPDLNRAIERFNGFNQLVRQTVD